MLWKQCIPKSYLIKSTICSIECQYSESGVLFHILILNKQKHKIDIVKKISTDNIDEVTLISKKYSSSIILSIVGKGILLKKIIYSNNENLEIDNLIKQNLSTINQDDFYVSFFQEQDNKGFLSACRKEQIDELIKCFSDNKIEIINIYLGPLVLNFLGQIINSYNTLYTNTYQVNIIDGSIDSILSLNNNQDFNLEVDQLIIPKEHLVSFAAGFGYFTHQSQKINPEIEFFYNNHIQKNGFKILFIFFVIISLFISVINSIVYINKFELNSSLDLELNLYESKNNKITQLIENYQKKKILIEQAGVFNNKIISIYADKIAETLPREIILRELIFNPEEVNNNNDSLTNYSENIIVIRGNCNKSLVLNDWINVLKNQNFIKLVTLESFVYNSEGYLPNFVLKINTK